MWGDRYLKSIDKFHEWTVSAWLTPGGEFPPFLLLYVKKRRVSKQCAQLHILWIIGVKIILLHELKNDEGIKLFLQDTWESYVKVCILFN